MSEMKYYSLMSVMLALLLSFFLSGCYTQLGRPSVDTDTYVQDEEEEYAEQDDDEADVVNYYDVYVHGAPPIYYGPNVWMFWSPYYRWYRHPGFYDPWWYSSYDAWAFGIYDPFYDPWYDRGWSYYNYWYYHPRNYNYWVYEDGNNYHYTKPQKKRDFDRRGRSIGEPVRSGQPMTTDDDMDAARRRRSSTDDRTISAPERLAKPGSVEKGKGTDSGQSSPEIRQPKKSSEPALITKPRRTQDSSSDKKSKPSSNTRKDSSSRSSGSSSPSYSKPSSSGNQSSPTRSSQPKSSGSSQKSGDSSSKKKK